MSNGVAFIEILVVSYARIYAATRDCQFFKAYLKSTFAVGGWQRFCLHEILQVQPVFGNILHPIMTLHINQRKQHETRRSVYSFQAISGGCSSHMAKRIMPY